MPNRLAHETSPYLLQHANNPVDWYPWGEEAFEKARQEDKPLLVSVGYAACHWCHVMEHESYENEEIARLMNERFVCVKVDREERPDVDAIYMQAVQALTGHGGWPMNVFVTPDGRPFYGGTYFPPQERYGMPGWPRVLEAVSDAYSNRPDEVQRNAEILTQSLQQAAAPQPSEDGLGPELLEEAYVGIAHEFDGAHGGFGKAPKFPQAMSIQFLLRHHTRTGDAHALHMVEHSLEAMATGGIYDHLGGGFHRYSVDEHWLVPHFEKMLYDNGLLALAYLEGYQITGNDSYRRVTEETLDYLLRDMYHPLGGFYSSQDADSEGEEGKFYLWTLEEIEQILGKEDGQLFAHCYGVTEGANFESKNILHLSKPFHTLAHELGLSQDALRKRLDEMRRCLFVARHKRVAPATDDKVLTAWNALVLRALAEAGAVLDRTDYQEAAERNADFLLEQLRPHGRLLRTWRDGKGHLNGYLADYSVLINGLLSLHEATFAHRWLHVARELTDEMLDLFWDEQHRTLYDVGKDHESLVVRPRDPFDNAEPCGNSAAAEALLRIGRLTGEGGYTTKAEALLKTVVEFIKKYPLGFGNWLRTFELYSAAPSEVAIIGPTSADATRELARVLHSRFEPNRIIVGFDPEEAQPFPSPLLEGRGLVGGRPAAYVCQGYTCVQPVTDPDALARQLAA